MNVKLKIEELENEVIFLRQTLREDFEDLYKQGGHQIIWEQHSEKDRYKTVSYTHLTLPTILLV